MLICICICGLTLCLILTKEMKKPFADKEIEEIEEMHRNSTSFKPQRSDASRSEQTYEIDGDVVPTHIHQNKSSESRVYSALQQKNVEFSSNISSAATGDTISNLTMDVTINEEPINDHRYAYNALPDIQEHGTRGNVMMDEVISNMIMHGQYYEDDDEDDDNDNETTLFHMSKISEMATKSKASTSRFHEQLSTGLKLSKISTKSTEMYEYEVDESSEDMEMTGLIVDDCNELQYDNEYYEEDD